MTASDRYRSLTRQQCLHNETPVKAIDPLAAVQRRGAGMSKHNHSAGGSQPKHGSSPAHQPTSPPSCKCTAPPHPSSRCRHTFSPHRRIFFFSPSVWLAESGVSVIPGRLTYFQRALHNGMHPREMTSTLRGAHISADVFSEAAGREGRFEGVAENAEKVSNDELREKHPRTIFIQIH